jgi:Zn-finger nucleic acid-binding protein
VTVDRCGSCHGLWFDGDEIEHAIDVTTKGVSREEAAALRRSLPNPSGPVEEVRYLACVRCGERMARRQAAPRAGTIVDICRDHGVWFDGGEFDRFAAFAKAGGLDVLRHDGIAAAEARARLAAAGAADVGATLVGHEEAGVRLTGAVARDVLRTLRGLFRGL